MNPRPQTLLPRRADPAWQTWLALGVVVLLAASLRLPGLARQSLWNDELSSVCIDAGGSAGDVVARVRQEDVHPPAYPLLLHYVQRWAGDSETAVRMPSAMAGVLAVLVMFLVGRELCSAREGLVGALLLTTAWFPIYYSQEARAYALLMLTTLTATLAWLRLQGVTMRRPTAHRRTWTILYFATAVASCYLHYFGLQFVVIQGITALALSLRDRRRLTHTLLLYGAIGAAYVPWLPSMWGQLQRGHGWIPRPNATFLFDYVTELCNRSRLIAWPVSAALLLLLVLTVRDLARRRRRAWTDLILWTWFLAPYALAHLQSLVASPVLTPRNLIASAPALYLLLVRSLRRLPLGKPGRTVAGCLLGAALLFHVNFAMHYTTGVQKEQFREAVEDVIQRDAAYRAPVVGCAPNIEYFNYYFRRFGSPKRMALRVGRPEDIAPFDAFVAREHPRYLWFLMAHEASAPEFAQHVMESYEVVSGRTLYFANVALMRAKDQPAGAAGGSRWSR